jgi:hypothetical protein
MTNVKKGIKDMFKSKVVCYKCNGEFRFDLCRRL